MLRAIQNTLPAGLALILGSLLGSCDLLPPDHLQFTLIEDAPAWFENEFRRGEEELGATWAHMAERFERDSAETARITSGVGAFIEDEFQRGRAGLDDQMGLLQDSVEEDARDFREVILGAPAWAVRDSERSLAALRTFLAAQGDRISAELASFGGELKNFLRVILY